MTCWIVTPVLRDVESFGHLRREVLSSVREMEVRFLVVDDSAGVDDEMTAVRALGDTEVLTPPFNLGHQRAIVFGLRHLAARIAADDVVVTMDADGEDQPTDVPRLLSALRDGTAPLAIAQRTSRTESFRFRVMYVFFRILFRALTGTTVRSGNFAAQRGASLVATIDHPSFDLCYSSSLLALRRPTVMVPCARGHRYAGRSRMSNYGLIAHGIRMLLPYSERIAVRAFLAALGSLAAVIATAVAVALGAGGSSPGPAPFVLLGVLGLSFVTSFVGFIVLFPGFAQASAVAMKGIGAEGTD
ncbi:MAG: glycosyltransferase [Ilumatobacteraceae bacterium]